MPISTVARHQDLFTTDQARAERILLELADYIYANAALKPMSKTLFAISRLMVLVRRFDRIDLSDARALAAAYEVARADFATPLVDDFAFHDIAKQCQKALPRIVHDLGVVTRLVGDGDGLGLLFNTLVRGKWDAGEGMGTFLTPEEIVDAIVAMALTRNEAVASRRRCLAGDICGGTGRFPFALARALRHHGPTSGKLPAQIFSFDQSTLATDYARLNLHFMGLQANCEVVGDSLVDETVGRLKGKCSILATNPPFGAGKYQLSQSKLQEIPRPVLKILVGRSRTQAVDPALLFVFRNLDLLCAGGVLGIVLPDGVLRSSVFSRALRAYENDRQTPVEVRAIVSLPTVTFAFGGTLAKTSFLIVSKNTTSTEDPLFVGCAQHIGYLKQGNRRIPNKRGNDLPEIVRAYRQPPGDGSAWGPNWRQWARLGVSPAVQPVGEATGVPLNRHCTVAREYTHIDVRTERTFHISVLDVDETGLIDVLASLCNRPRSRVLACQPGDVLLSCINPRIWRVAVVPSLRGTWTCSAEFLVLRPRNAVSSWELAMRLHHRRFKAVIQSMAGGTSSSRQRVDKGEVLTVAVPRIRIATHKVEAHAEGRAQFYARRIAEGQLYEALHTGRHHRTGDLAESMD